MLTLWRHYMTLNSLSRCHICKNGPGVVTISLNDHGSERFEQIWLVYNVFDFSPLTYLRTCEQDVVTRWYAKSCDFKIFLSTTVAVARLQTFFWRLSHLTWPGDLSWDDLESNCSQNVRKRCQYSFCLAISWTNLGKGESQTPRVERRASCHS